MQVGRSCITGACNKRAANTQSVLQTREARSTEGVAGASASGRGNILEPVIMESLLINIFWDLCSLLSKGPTLIG